VLDRRSFGMEIALFQLSSMEARFSIRALSSIFFKEKSFGSEKHYIFEKWQSAEGCNCLEILNFV